MNPTSHDSPFNIGDTDFMAVRMHRPCDHWRVKVVESGEVLEAGADGFNTESRPKMQRDIEDMLRRVGDIDLFRRHFNLPPRVQRVRDVAARAGVTAVYDEDQQSWACEQADGRMQYGAPSETAALLAGLRNCDALQEFRLSVRAYVRADDTFLVVHAEQWLAKPQVTAAAHEEPAPATPSP